MAMGDETSSSSDQVAGRNSSRPRIDGRQAVVLDLLHAEGRVAVSDLARRFGVSTMTIRRDLANLEQGGRVRRVYGGAVPVTPEPFGRRATVRAAEKQRIARAVDALVQPNETVGIDIGTTCHAVARELAARKGIFAVTPSLPAALEFKHSESQVLVLGGLMNSELALIHTSQLAAAPVYLDRLVLSSAGLDAAAGVTNFNLAETEVRRFMMANANSVILAVDQTKLNVRKAIHLCGLEALDTVVTTAPPPPPLNKALRAASVDVIVA